MLNDLSEEDTKRLLITPVIEKVWDKQLIRMEVKLTDGRFIVEKNGCSRREKPFFADYVLYYENNYPLAIVEAKSNTKSAGDGVQQAKEYAKMLNVPFAYASNGKTFIEYDFLTGTECEISMEKFPSREALYARWVNCAQISETQQKIIRQPYFSDAGTNAPRYYQQVAINKTVEAIAGGKDRLLLVMATGTGKTYTAFQIVWRLLQAGLVHKVLYLADRNVLIDQTIDDDFLPLKNVSHKIDVSHDSKQTLSSYQLLFSLYQQLVGDNGKEHFKDLFEKDFFDLIIVDECHRGSANDDSCWRAILEYFSGATQIGMTATPKETKYTSNINYFGDPVYVYSLKQGIADGFLAPFRVINCKTNIGDGWRPYVGQRDKNGQLIPDRIYKNSDFDYNIVLEDRTREVAAEITRYLKTTKNRMAKTIVFCANEDAADRMRRELVNLNSDMMQKNADYVVRITGSDEVGKGKLKEFISMSVEYPVIATTSKLLSTGVNTRMVKLIVLDESIASMTEFKQIIGRGTRLVEKLGKTHFTVMDFRNVTHLFADEEWDGPIEPDDDYDPEERKPTPTGDGPGKGEAPTGANERPIVGKDGCPVKIIDRQTLIYDSNGKVRLPLDYCQILQNILKSPDDWREKWQNAIEKTKVLEELDSVIDFDDLQKGFPDDDIFDILGYLAFGTELRSRESREQALLVSQAFSNLGVPAEDIFLLFLAIYKTTGIRELESDGLLSRPEFQTWGKPAKIDTYFVDFGGVRRFIQTLISKLYQ